MRILFVAIGTSVHTARWISQLAGLGWDVHLFNATPEWGLECNPILRDVTVHGLRSWCRANDLEGTRRYSGFNWLSAETMGHRASRALYHAGAHFFPAARARKVAKLIDTLKPDLVHSLEFQHSAYLVLDAQQFLKSPMPKWWAANWGSDIFHFGHDPAHKPRIEQVLAKCDYYSCETTRDIGLGRDHGFRKRVMTPVIPSIGGFDLAQMQRHRAPGPVSARRTIVVKGYQGLFGRAITALKAIEFCADVLGDYQIDVFSGFPETIAAAQAVVRRTGLKIRCLDHAMPNEKMLELHGRARASIGLSTSDGCSTSFLETLAMGSIPIQSYTAEPHEYITDGESGFIVDPDDPQQVARGLRHILASDAWVDQASERNWQTTCRKLDAAKLRPLVLDWYRSILAETKSPRGRSAEPVANALLSRAA